MADAGEGPAESPPWCPDWWVLWQEAEIGEMGEGEKEEEEEEGVH